VIGLCLTSVLLSVPVLAQNVLPKLPVPFHGKIGETYKDSKSDFPNL
jgi:hypothetical protein